jgi:hypothetical protein
MARDLNKANCPLATVFSAMSVHSNTTRGCDVPAALFADVPRSNGKKQPWTAVWPPAKKNLQDVAESEGQMLLLDGTGGSGTKAVPNAVYLPPKSDKPRSDKEDTEDKEKPKAEAPTSGK